METYKELKNKLLSLKMEERSLEKQLTINRRLQEKVLKCLTGEEINVLE